MREAVTQEMIDVVSVENLKDDTASEPVKRSHEPSEVLLRLGNPRL